MLYFFAFRLELNVLQVLNDALHRRQWKTALDKILSIDWDNNKENWKQAAQSADVLTGFTPLHHLAWSGNTAGIEIFISRFPNVRRRDRRLLHITHPEVQHVLLV